MEIVPDKEKLGVIKKFPIEFLVFVCIVGISVLFVKFDNLDNDYRSFLKDTSAKLQEIISNNTQVIKDANAAKLQENSLLQQRITQENQNQTFKKR